MVEAHGCMYDVVEPQISIPGASETGLKREARDDPILM